MISNIASLQFLWVYLCCLENCCARIDMSVHVLFVAFENYDKFEFFHFKQFHHLHLDDLELLMDDNMV